MLYKSIAAVLIYLHVARIAGQPGRRTLLHTAAPEAQHEAELQEVLQNVTGVAGRPVTYKNVEAALYIAYAANGKLPPNGESRRSFHYYVQCTQPDSWASYAIEFVLNITWHIIHDDRLSCYMSGFCSESQRQEHACCSSSLCAACRYNRRTKCYQASCGRKLNSAVLAECECSHRHGVFLCVFRFRKALNGSLPACPFPSHFSVPSHIPDGYRTWRQRRNFERPAGKQWNESFQLNRAWVCPHIP